MIFLSLYRDDFDFFVLLLQEGCNPCDRATCAAACEEMRQFTVCLLPYFWPCAFIMGQKVGIVFVLIGHIIDVWSRFRNRLGQSNTLIGTSAHPWTKII